MPLSAMVDGELVCAPVLAPKRWDELKGRQVVLQPCGHHGFPRVSRLGTQHFVHERDSGCEHSESAEHLHLKAVVAKAVAEAGWHAGTEVAGAGFIADVMACRNGSQIAFEVQRSKQTLREYQRRQQRYAEHGVRGVWLARHIPAGYICSAELPLFVVTDWDKQPRAIVVGRELSLMAVVGSLLSGEIQWRDGVTVHQQLQEHVRLLCPACGKVRQVVIANWGRGSCDCGLPVLNQQTNPSWWERGRCCGYWGPAMLLSRWSRSTQVVQEIPAGHWCWQAGGEVRVSA